MSQRQLERLLHTVSSADEILILPHNNPDPDAIASAVALRYLLMEKLDVEARIAYQGIIGRAENRALVRYLVHPLRPLLKSDLEPSTPVAFIDTQPGAGNSVEAPPWVNIAVVIDHHSPLRSTEAIQFSDFRPQLGATATILTEYIMAAELELPSPLATALFYGIKTNTMGLGRNVDKADAAAYYYLQPLIDVKGLSDIEHARVPTHYFKGFDIALRSAKLYDHVLISYMGPLLYPDLTAEMADLLLRLEESRWVICMGVYEEAMIISVRTSHQEYSAEELVTAIIGVDGVAGGHGSIAGGQSPLEGQDADEAAARLTSRTLQRLHVAADTTGKPLFE